MLAYKFHWLVGLIFAGFAMLAVGLVIGLPNVLLMAVALIGVPVVSFVLGRLMMRGFACERRAPSTVSEGEQAAIVLSVTNTGWLPKFYIQIGDDLPLWLKLASPLGEIRGLAAGDTAEVTYWVEAEKRGAHSIGPPRIRVSDALGFWLLRAPLRQSEGLPADTELLVLPTVYPIRSFLVDGAGAWGMLDHQNARTRESGLDFQGVREYRPGDELRRVHWRTTARTGKLAVMEYGHGMGADVMLALDLSRDSYAGTGSGRESALEYAIRIVASVGTYLLENGYSVTLVNQTIGEPLTLRRPQDATRLLEVLARAESNADRPLADMLEGVIGTLSLSNALVYITPQDGDADLNRAIERYNTNGTPAFGFILDRDSFGRPIGRGKTVRSGASEEPDQFSSVKLVRRGDDILRAIEGARHGRA